MNMLLDTHAVIWFLKGNEKMPKTTRNVIRNFENRKYVSIASIWEVAIKSSSGKLKLDNDINGFIETIENNGFLLLDITPDHVKAVAELPFIHRDPFDRILIAQATSEDMAIITIDENIAKYNVNIIW